MSLGKNASSYKRLYRLKHTLALRKDNKVDRIDIKPHN